MFLNFMFLIASEKFHAINVLRFSLNTKNVSLLLDLIWFSINHLDLIWIQSMDRFANNTYII